ncbi:MAG: GyrI-like domain-containing protein [Oscillospiraceae bacterium]|nr:GyrI-like domain-containing protein [Oscillospiraceae bacterium]
MFDFKKEYREFYLPKNVPSLVTVPAAQFLAVTGRGDPNEPDGAYQAALAKLYAIAYTLKMSYKTDYRIKGFYEYVVPPLEGFWNLNGAVLTDKSVLEWVSVIRLPDFITEADVQWARETVLKKKKLDCSDVELRQITEGLCVQIMHIGSYDDEPATIARMEQFMQENGYQTDLEGGRHHHEIYLSDPRKTAPDKLKTVIRLPVRITKGASAE